jgi:hypothetical protein
MEGICQFYNGAVPMDAHGTRILVPLQLRVVISMFYSGAVQTDVRGMNGLVQWQLRMGIY